MRFHAVGTAGLERTMLRERWRLILLSDRLQDLLNNVAGICPTLVPLDRGAHP